MFAPDNGAFGEYAVVKEHVQLKTPANVTDEEAATLGVSVITVVRSHPYFPFPRDTYLPTYLPPSLSPYPSIS